MTSSYKIPKERRLQVYNTVYGYSVIVLLIWILLLLPNVIFGKTIMINGVAVNTSNSRQLNFALLDAVEYVRIEDVRRLLDLGASVKARNRFGNTALLLAAQKGHLNIMQLLLGAGSD
ncbi:MAG: ankyrin repeat domain-containing protein, partial [Dehalococcoidia bacterium]|nr:ankyrin repeat domain-containing protein [Dehalococcoidia bacterium]